MSRGGRAAKANGRGVRQVEIDRITSRDAGSVPGFVSCGALNMAEMCRHMNEFFRKRGMPVNEFGFQGMIHQSAQAGLRKKEKRGS